MDPSLNETRDDLPAGRPLVRRRPLRDARPRAFRRRLDARGKGRRRAADQRDRGARALDHLAQRLPRHRLRAVDQSLSRLRARLRLLLRPPEPCVPRALAGARLRDQAVREDQRGRAAARRALEAGLRTESDRHRREYRLLPADRAKIQDHPADRRDPRRMRASVHDGDQVRPGRARPGPACADGEEEPGEGLCLHRQPRPRARAQAGAARRQPAAANGRSQEPRPGRRAVRRNGRRFDTWVERQDPGGSVGGGFGGRGRRSRLCHHAAAQRAERAVQGMAGGALPPARRPRHQPRAPDARRPGQRPALRQPHDRHRSVRRADREALRYRLPPLRPQRARRRAQAAEPRLQPLPPALRGRTDAAVLVRAALLAIGWGWAAAIVWLSLTPAPPKLDFEHGDKLGHFLAYGVLMFWFCLLYLKTRVRILYAAGFIAMGIGLEFIQGWLVYRTYDPLDMLANTIGVALGWMASLVIRIGR